MWNQLAFKAADVKQAMLKAEANKDKAVYHNDSKGIDYWTRDCNKKKAVLKAYEEQMEQLRTSNS
jgi:hypothetical protein